MDGTDNGYDDDSGDTPKSDIVPVYMKNIYSLDLEEDEEEGESVAINNNDVTEADNNDLNKNFEKCLNEGTRDK